MIIHSFDHIREFNLLVRHLNKAKEFFFLLFSLLDRFLIFICKLITIRKFWIHSFQINWWNTSMIPVPKLEVNLCWHGLSKQFFLLKGEIFSEIDLIRSQLFLLIQSQTKLIHVFFIHLRDVKVRNLNTFAFIKPANYAVVRYYYLYMLESFTVKVIFKSRNDVESILRLMVTDCDVYIFWSLKQFVLKRIKLKAFSHALNDFNGFVFVDFDYFKKLF